MKGLLYKDLLNIWKSMRKLFIIFFMVAGMAGLADPTTGVAVGMLVFMGCSLPISSVAMDERSGWDRFAAASPLPRWMIVVSKYLLLLIYGGTAFALSLALTAISCAVHRLPLTAEMFIPHVLVLAVALPAPSLTLPLVFKFGSEKGRLFLFVIVLGLCVPFLMLTTLFGDAIQVWITAYSHLLPLLFGVGGTLLALLIVGGSLIYSLRIYSRKDF